jgi:hypothetical protein
MQEFVTGTPLVFTNLVPGKELFNDVVFDVDGNGQLLVCLEGVLNGFEALLEASVIPYRLWFGCPSRHGPRPL